VGRNVLGATGWAVGGSNPGGGEIFHTRSKVKERVEIYIYSSAGPSWSVMG